MCLPSAWGQAVALYLQDCQWMLEVVWGKGWGRGGRVEGCTLTWGTSNHIHFEGVRGIGRAVFLHWKLQFQKIIPVIGNIFATYFAVHKTKEYNSNCLCCNHFSSYRYIIHFFLWIQSAHKLCSNLSTPFLPSSTTYFRHCETSNWVMVGLTGWLKYVICKLY